MGLFDTPAVKELKKQAHFIGGLHGQVHLGHFLAGDLNDLVHDEAQRAQLRDAFAAAARDVGDQKALKAAVKSANLGADSFARLGNSRYGEVVRQAERTVREMLGR